MRAPPHNEFSEHSESCQKRPQPSEQININETLQINTHTQAKRRRQSLQSPGLVQRQINHVLSVFPPSTHQITHPLTDFQVVFWESDFPIWKIAILAVCFFTTSPPPRPPPKSKTGKFVWSCLVVVVAAAAWKNMFLNSVASDTKSVEMFFFFAFFK